MAADLGMFVDVVDERNHPIGVAPRAEVLPKKLGFRTVHIFLFDPAGRLLLQKLPDAHLRSPGRLGSSVAGYLHAGESYRAGALRKMREELHIQTAIRQTAIWPMIDSGSRKFVGLFSGVTSQRPTYDPEEIAEMVYMSPDALSSETRRYPERFTPTFVFVYERFRRSSRAP